MTGPNLMDELDVLWLARENQNQKCISNEAVTYLDTNQSKATALVYFS